MTGLALFSLRSGLLRLPVLNSGPHLIKSCRILVPFNPATKCRCANLVMRRIVPTPICPRRINAMRQTVPRRIGLPPPLSTKLLGLWPHAIECTHPPHAGVLPPQAMEPVLRHWQEESYGTTQFSPQDAPSAEHSEQFILRQVPYKSLDTILYDTIGGAGDCLLRRSALTRSTSLEHLRATAIQQMRSSPLLSRVYSAE